MKNVFIVCFAILICSFLACSSESEPEPDFPESTITASSQVSSNGSPNEILINPNRPYYDVVVMDVDRWDICLNVKRARPHVTSYTGHLWYQAGSFIFEGKATAMYYPSLDLLTVTALDSGWDRGHITYSLQFKGDSNDMEGCFVYYEYARRTNSLPAWLVQGQLGSHDAGPYIPKRNPTGQVSDIHPKKARAERYEDIDNIGKNENGN